MPHYTMPDGEQLYVRQVGQGQPVLVLSGLGMQSWQWLPFIAPHLKHYQFIIPDWRGFGGSAQCAIPAHLNAIQSHWQDTASLIEQLNLDQFRVIAYSMGATTAMHGMHYAALGNQLSAYLHIDQSPKIGCDDTWQYGLLGQQQPALKQLMREMNEILQQYPQLTDAAQLPTTARRALIARWIEFIELQASSKITPRVLRGLMRIRGLEKHVLPMQRLDYLAWYLNNYLHHAEDYRDAVTQLNCPTTFFMGEQSTLYPIQGQREIANRVAQSTQVLFKKSGHAPLLSEPLKFSREIAIFLHSTT